MSTTFRRPSIKLAILGLSLASVTMLKTTASSATDDITTVWYGVKATSAQPNGAYSDTVTYTATTNP